MPGSKVTFYHSAVKAKCKDATRAGLLALGYQILAESQPNVPVDTGFLRNSGYVYAQGEGGPPVGPGYGPAPPLGADSVVVGYAALYAIFQELKLGFIWGAAQRVTAAAGAILEPVFRSRI